MHIDFDTKIALRRMTTTSAMVPDHNRLREQKAKARCSSGGSYLARGKVEQLDAVRVSGSEHVIIGGVHVHRGQLLEVVELGHDPSG